MEETKRIVGVVVGTRISNGELLLRIDLAEPVDPTQIAGSEVDGFRDGVPLGTKIEARFVDAHSDTIEISMFDKTVAWKDGVFEANAPRFIGKHLSIRST